MSVKTENVVGQAEEIVDDVSSEEVKTADAISSNTMAALKAKLAKKNQTEENVKAALEKVEGEKMPIVIVEKKIKSLNISCIGAGQAGSRLAAEWASLGNSAVAINTAQQDLTDIKLPEDCKLLTVGSIGGSAKDTSVGEEIASNNRDAIAELISDKLGDAQVFLVCTSLGGGSGAGALPVIIDILAQLGCPIMVLTVLPLSTDDVQTKSNALETLAKLTKLAQSKIVSNIFIIDNSRIESIFAQVSQMSFFDVSNKLICEPLNAFNKYSAQPSANKALDSMEFAKIATDGNGVSVFGTLDVHDYESDTAIAEAVINSHSDNLLASGFDLSQTKYAGIIVVANPEVWQKLSSNAINYAIAMLNEQCPKAISVFRGLYEDSTMKPDHVKIYSMFSGLGLPLDRINSLKTEVQTEMAKVKTRDQSHNTNLQFDTGKDFSISEAEKVRDIIKKKSSSFNKNFTGIKDFRKK